jgi:hypothetical protein
MLTSSISIQVASVFITNSIIAEFLISALKSRSTGVLSCHVTGVESKGRCHRIGFPDIHLGTAGSFFAHSSSGIPLVDVGFSVDEFDIVWALSVTVSSAVSSTGRVGTFTKVSILTHLHKVEGTVQTTGKLRNIDIEGELLSSEFEHLVVVVIGHHVHATTDVFGILTLSNKSHLEVVSGSLNAVGASERIVVDSVESAVARTTETIRTGA